MSPIWYNPFHNLVTYLSMTNSTCQVSLVTLQTMKFPISLIVARHTVTCLTTSIIISMSNTVSKAIF
jgi:hypothetical protein